MDGIKAVSQNDNIPKYSAYHKILCLPREIHFAEPDGFGQTLPGTSEPSKITSASALIPETRALVIFLAWWRLKKQPPVDVRTFDQPSL